MSDAQQPRQTGPVRLHDEPSGAFEFDTITGAQRVFKEFAKDLRRAQRQDKKRSRMTLWGVIFGLGGASATGVYVLDLASWFAENRLQLESKADAKDAHDKINERIDEISTKLDDLPKRVAEEVRRRR